MNSRIGCFYMLWVSPTLVGWACKPGRRASGLVQRCLCRYRHKQRSNSRCSSSLSVERAWEIVLLERYAEPCRMVRFSRSMNEVFNVEESSELLRVLSS